jgi:hypothetical protein
MKCNANHEMQCKYLQQQQQVQISKYLHHEMQVVELSAQAIKRLKVKGDLYKCESGLV